MTKKHSVPLTEALAKFDKKCIDALCDRGHRVSAVQLDLFADTFSGDSPATLDGLDLFLDGVDYLMTKYGDSVLTIPLERFKVRMAVAYFNFAASYDMREMLAVALRCRNMLSFINEPTSAKVGGWTPLFTACADSNAECALMLIAMGCDWRIQNCVGSSPLWYISKNDSMSEVVKALLDNGADPNERRCNQYSCAARSIVGEGCVANLKVYLESGKVDGNTLLGDKGTNDATLLMLSAACGNLDATFMCLERGGSPLKNDRSLNAIEYAIAFQQWQCAKLLLYHCKNNDLFQAACSWTSDPSMLLRGDAVGGPDPGMYLSHLFSNDFVFYGKPMQNLDQFQSFCLEFMRDDQFLLLLSNNGEHIEFLSSNITPEQLLIEERNAFKCTDEQRKCMESFEE